MSSADSRAEPMRSVRPDAPPSQRTKSTTAIASRIQNPIMCRNPKPHQPIPSLPIRSTSWLLPCVVFESVVGPAANLAKASFAPPGQLMLQSSIDLQRREHALQARAYFAGDCGNLGAIDELQDRPRVHDFDHGPPARVHPNDHVAGQERADLRLGL